MQALWIVRQFPRQIRRDLHRFHNGLKLADWWAGTRDHNGDLVLSSAELLDYLEFMDDDGAFKTAAERGGRWSDWKNMLAEAANSGYRMHASYLIAHGVEDVGDTSDYEFTDPVILKERAEKAQAEAQAQAESQERFEAEIGY